MPRKKFLFRRLWYIGKGNKKRLHFYVGISIAIIIFTLLLYIIESFSLPNIAQASKYQTEKLLSDRINSEVLKHLSENEHYEDYVTISKDNDNRIEAVKTDVAKLNELVFEVNNAVRQNLTALKNLYVSIPFSVLYKKSEINQPGQGISVQVLTSDRVQTEFVSELTPLENSRASHKIYLKIVAWVDTKFSFLMKKSFAVTTIIPVTEMIFEKDLSPAFFESMNIPVLE